MVDRDVFARRAAAVAHHVRRLRDKGPPTAPELEADEDLRNSVLMDLLQAIQSCMDLAVHVCAHDALGVIEGPASAFALLATHGVIDADLSVRLAGAVGMRNIIVHRYGHVSLDEIAVALTEGLADLERFIGAVRSYAAADA